MFNSNEDEKEQETPQNQSKTPLVNPLLDLLGKNAKSKLIEAIKQEQNEENKNNGGENSENASKNNPHNESQDGAKKEEIPTVLPNAVPKFFMKVLNNIKKDKGLNIFNSFDYIMNGLINLYFERKGATQRIKAFRTTWELDSKAADEEVFVNFMETFTDFNFFE